MSNENQETIADIVAKMRGPYYKMGRSNASLDKQMMDYMSFMSNRIEAAEKREREAGAEAAQICGKIGELIGRVAACKEKVTDCNNLGNYEKMREALSRILGIADHLQTRFAIPKFASEEILELKQIAESALAAPPRNVDEGEGEKKCTSHN